MTPVDIRSALLTRPLDALMLTLFGEAASEPQLGQVAVACCIRNRATHPRWWGSDVSSVCLKKWQFSCWWETETMNSKRLFALAETVLKTPTPIDSDQTRALYAVADGVLSDATADITNTADHYVTQALLAVAPPTWSLGRTPCAHIGHHVFYRLEI